VQDERGPLADRTQRAHERETERVAGHQHAVRIGPVSPRQVPSVRAVPAEDATLKSAGVLRGNWARLRRGDGRR